MRQYVFPHVRSLTDAPTRVFLVGALLMLVALVLAAPVAAQQFERGQWSAPPAFRGLNDSAMSLAFDKDNNLYAGGYFQDAGGDSNADRVAKWDGTRWNALGNGFNKSVQSLVVDSKGTLYAGGIFTMLGDNKTPMRYVARWDGTAWTPLAFGLDGKVLVMAIDPQDRLVVGGDFRGACRDQACSSTTPMQRIARWDGTAWSALGPGLDNSVQALAFDRAGNLYVGGDFKNTGLGTTELQHLAKWDGKTWSAVGGGVSGSIMPTVHAMAIDGIGDLYVAGRFQLAGKLFASRIAKWNGKEWGLLDTGMNYGVYSLTTDARGDLFAGGFFTRAGKGDASHVAKWDPRANTWLQLGGGLDNTVYSLTVSPTQVLYAGGDFLDADGDPNADRVAQWIVKTAANVP